MTYIYYAIRLKKMHPTPSSTRGTKKRQPKATSCSILNRHKKKKEKKKKSLVNKK